MCSPSLRSGTLDYEELKEAIKELSEAKNVAMAQERTLAKKVSTLEREAKEAQLAVKLLLLEDEKKKAAEAEAQAREEEQQRIAREAAEAEAKAKAEAKEAAKKKKEAEFEKKILEKRNNRDDSAFARHDQICVLSLVLCKQRVSHLRSCYCSRARTPTVHAAMEKMINEEQQLRDQSRQGAPAGAVTLE